MNEKVIIKSEMPTFKAYYTLGLPVGICVLGLILYIMDFDHSRVSYYSHRTWSILANMLDPFSFVPGLLIDIGLILLVVFVFFVFMISGNEMTVTNMRVYGVAKFGKRVDLPLDKISAVGTGLFNSITVNTSSGVIKFALIKNQDDVYNAISKLLLKRQSTVETEIKNDTNSHATENVNDLKKYKELLESGLISQEDYDAKKKQILGI